MANSFDDEQQLSPEGILPSKVNRSFLHSNSTSHTWPFSAFAELIDNAYDPGVDARCLKIDVEDISGIRCLSFTDDGTGMTPKQLHKMLSFGFCEKDVVGEGGQKKARTLGSSRNHIPLGQYGNGFKSGSMRLGRDAIVFTKSSSDDDKTMSIGLLSQNFLEAIEAETVLVPIVTWNQTTKELRQSAKDRSLDHILTHSILFTNEDELLQQFDCIEDNKGTRIIIYSLKQGSDSLYELDLDTDLKDILNPETTEAEEPGGSSGSRELQEHPLCRKSLREYCSMLFLNSRMKIVLRRKEVKIKRPYQNLINKKEETYKPRNQTKTIKITFGRWNEERRHIDCDYGVLFYYKNRLIKAYEKIGCQKKGKGIDITGIIEIPPDIDNIIPIHNKQDFLQTNRFSSLMKELTRKLNFYCNEATAVKITGKQSVVCARCEKKRYLPDNYELDESEEWFCHMNPDSTCNRCEIKEESKLLIVRLPHRPKKSKRRTSTVTNRRSLSAAEPCASPDSLSSLPSPFALPSAAESVSAREPIVAPDSPSASASAPASVPASASVSAIVPVPVSAPAPVPASPCDPANVPAPVSATVSVSATDPIRAPASVPVSAIVPAPVSASAPVLLGPKDLSLVPALSEADPALQARAVLESDLSRVASAAASAVFRSIPTQQHLHEPPVAACADRADASRSSSAVVDRGVNTLSPLHLQIELMVDNSVSTCRQNAPAVECAKLEDSFSVCGAGTAAVVTGCRRSVESRSVQTEARQMADAKVDATDLQAPIANDSMVEKKLIRLRQNVLKFLQSLDPKFHYETLEEIDKKFEEFLKINSQSLQPTDEDKAPRHHDNHLQHPQHHLQQQQQRKQQTKLRQSKRTDDVADSSAEAKKASCMITRWMLKKERSPSPLIILDSDDDVSNSSWHLEVAPDVQEAPAVTDARTVPASATRTTPTEEQSPADQKEVDQVESTWKPGLGNRRRHNASKLAEESPVQIKQLRKN